MHLVSIFMMWVFNLPMWRPPTDGLVTTFILKSIGGHPSQFGGGALVADATIPQVRRFR